MLTSRLSLITICKDDLAAFDRTLKTILSFMSRIEFIAVINCEPCLVNEYQSLIMPGDHIKLAFNQDHSLYNAMNIGIQAKSKGNPFLFLNAGDLLNPKCVDLLLLCSNTIQHREIYCFKSFISNQPLDLWNTLGESCSVNPNSDSSPASAKTREGKGFINEYISRYLKFPCHQSILYGSYFDHLRFDEALSISSDIFFNSQAFRLASSLKFRDEPLAIFDDSGISNRSSLKKRLRDRLNGIKNSPISLLDIRILAGSFATLLKYLFNFFSK